MVCGEDQCNKVTTSMLPVNTLFDWQKWIDCICRLCVNIAAYLLFSSSISTRLRGKIKNAKLSRETHFISSFFSRTSVFQASQALFCGLHVTYMKLCFPVSKLLHCHLLVSGTGSTAVHQAQSIAQQVDNSTQKSSFLPRY